MEQRRCLCLNGNDLDDDNLKLLRDGCLTVALDPDLRQDMSHDVRQDMAAPACW